MSKSLKNVEKLWTVPFIKLTVAMLFLFTGFYLLLPTLPMYIKELGGNESQIGLTVGAFTITAVIFRPIVGAMLDRYGRRLFMIGGLLFFTICVYLYDWASGIAVLFLLRILHGASWAFATTATGTAVTDMIPVSRRGEGMGWYGLAMTLAMAVGPLAGLWVIGQHSFHVLFWLATALSAVALILSLSTHVPFQPKEMKGKLALFEKSVLSVTVAIFFLAISYGGITTFLPLMAEDLGANSGMFFLVYALTLTLIRPVAGKLSDRYGESVVIVPALVTTVGALLVLSMAQGMGGLIVSAVLYGIGFGSAQPALQAATLRLAPEDRRGVANASFFTAFDLGIGLGAILLGAVSELAGYRELFVVSAVSVVGSTVIFVVFVRRLLRKRSAMQ